MIAAFKNYNIASSARIILLNPLHPLLPRVVLLLAATCNKFKTEDVELQWKTIKQEYCATLESVLGPLIGQSSDGDSRRRKLMLANMRSEDGERFQPIAKEYGFTLSAKKEVNILPSSAHFKC